MSGLEGGGVRVEGVMVLVGPARLVVESGSVEVLGYEVGEGGEVVAPVGRGVPIRGSGAVVQVTPSASRLVRGDEGVYRAMEEAASRVASLEPPVVLVGPGDAGKSTLAAWAAVLASRGGGSWLLEADVGQNEVYAPGFEAIARVEPPFVPGWDRGGVPGRCFVGSYTPSRALSRYLGCASLLAARAGGFVVVDTDGWVEAWEGLYSKAALAAAVGARSVVHVGLGDAASRALEELAPWARHVRLPRLAPSGKSRGDRRTHRERLVTARLVGSKPRPVRLGDAVVTGLPMGLGSPLDPQALEAAGLPARLVERAETAGGQVVVVARRRLRPPPGVRVYQAGAERGLLSAVHPRGGGDPYLGVVEKANYRSGVVTVHTTYDGPVRLLEVGEARVEWPPTY